MNPPSGTHDVVVNLSANPDKGIVIGVTTFEGVNQLNPLGGFVSAQDNSITSSVTVSSATGELVFDVMTMRNATISVGSGQTQLWNETTVEEIKGGGGSTEPGATSVTMSWTPTASQEWAIGAVSIKPTVANPTITFTETPTLCSDLTISAGNITITNYVSIVTGIMPANPNITAVLKYGATNILTLSNPTYSGGLLTWTEALGSEVTVPAGEAITLEITTAEPNVTFRIDYDSQSKPSKIDFPVTTYIDIISYAVYDAPYPGGIIITSETNGATVYIRAVCYRSFWIWVILLV